MHVVNEPAALARLLADPLRMRILERLMAGGATPSELVSESGSTQPNVSNHLAMLREGGLVATERVGRHVTYTIASPEVAALVEALIVAAGTPLADRAEGSVPAVTLARTCYDHVAGRLGVALFSALVARDALAVPLRAPHEARKVRSGMGEVTLGPAAAEVFAELAIDVERVAEQRRHFATACKDWTENRPHLGGALGAALWERLRALRWVARRPGTRALTITQLGRTELQRRYAIDVSALC